MDILPRSDEVLIDAIYATLAGESSWQNLLEVFARDLPDGSATLHFSDTSGNYRPFIISHGVDEAALQAYARFYGEINPIKLNCDNRPASEGVLCDQPIPYPQFVGTKSFAGFMRQIGTQSEMGVIIEHEEFGVDSHCAFILSLLTTRHNVEQNRPFALQLLRIAPHLQRVARAYRKGLFQKGIAAISKSLLDGMGVGFIVCGDFGKVSFLSTAAQQMAANTRCFNIERQHLRLLHQQAQQTLEWMLDRNYTGTKTMSFTHQDTRITLVHTPKDCYEMCFEGPTILVILEETNNEGGLDIECKYLALAYGLSKAETRVLKGLLEGDSIACIAVSHSRSPETIRSQVKQIYAKTGAHSRMKLAQLAGEALLRYRQQLKP